MNNRISDVQLNAWPLCFHSTLLESEIGQRECSDGIYVSSHYFRHFNRTDSDEIVILKLTNDGVSAYATISGVHSEDNDSILMPSWLCQFLEVECGNSVLVEIFTESRMGLKIRIQAHTSEYTTLDDPVAAIRDAFEHYTTLVSGMTIPLYVNGSNLLVNIIDTFNMNPICIRGSELAVEIDRPLDMPEEPIASMAPLPSVDFDELPMVPVTNRFPGTGYTLGRR